MPKKAKEIYIIPGLEKMQECEHEFVKIWDDSIVQRQICSYCGICRNIPTLNK